MTLTQRIALIDMMITENPDATIRHYLELAGDVQGPVEFTEPPPLVPMIPLVRNPRKLPKKQHLKYLQTYRLRL